MLPRTLAIPRRHLARASLLALAFVPLLRAEVAIHLVSATPEGVAASAGAISHGIDHVGEIIPFDSRSTDLVPGVAPFRHVYARNRATGETFLASVPEDESQQVDDDSFLTSRVRAVSADGRRIVFGTQADLIPVHERWPQIVVYDRTTRSVQLASVSTSGQPVMSGSEHSGAFEGAISRDGRYVVFLSNSADLIDDDDRELWSIFLRDLTERTTVRLLISGDQGRAFPFGNFAMSGDNRFLAFRSDIDQAPGDDNGVSDVYRLNLGSGELVVVSANAQHDPGNHHSGLDSIDIIHDGSQVVFSSAASNLVPGDTNDLEDVFLRDLATGATGRLSISQSGAQSDGSSSFPTISSNGERVAFASTATNLGPDADPQSDVFVHDRRTGEPTLVSQGRAGERADGASGTPTISGDGRSVAFGSTAGNLVDPGIDTNGAHDIYLAVLGRANRAPLAQCRDVVVDAEPGECFANVSPAQVDAGSFDPDGDPIILDLSPSGPYTVGTTQVFLTVNDGSEISVCEAAVTVIDREPPRLDVALRTVLLLRPDHQLVDVLAHARATDSCFTPLVEVEVSQDEPIVGTSVDDLDPDAVVVRGSGGGISGLLLRAERDPQGDGRVYLIRFTATDLAGNSSTALRFVVVPRSRRFVDLISVLVQGIVAQLVGAPLPYTSLPPVDEES